MLNLRTLRHILDLEHDREFRIAVSLAILAAILFLLSFVEHPWIDKVYYAVAASILPATIISVVFILSRIRR